MTKEELAKLSLAEIYALIDEAIKRSHIEFLRQLSK